MKEKVLLKEFVERWSEFSQTDESSLNWIYDSFVRTLKSFVDEKRSVQLKNFIKLELRKRSATKYHNLQTRRMSERKMCRETYRASLSANVKYPVE